MSKKSNKSRQGLTKKQLIVIIAIVVVVLGIGTALLMRATSNTTLSTSPVSSDIQKTADEKVDAIISKEVEENIQSTDNETPVATEDIKEVETPPTPAAPTADELCAKGTYIFSNDTLRCTNTIDVTQAPARLVVFAVETYPNYIQMYKEISYEVTCSVPSACVAESGTSTPGRVQIAISEPVVVNVSVKQTTTYNAKTYSFQQWELTQGGPNYGDGSYPYTLLGKFTAS